MENSFIKHDFRKDVVDKKIKGGNFRNWDKWDEWNILYRTLSYELSCSKDVENYPYVRDEAFKPYKKYICEYVGEGYTADIMNGWWHIFKRIFNITSRKNKEGIKEICDNIEKKSEGQVVQYLVNKGNLKGDEAIRKEIYKYFLEYLELVYTIGNIAPVPHRCNQYVTSLDNWKPKLVKFGHKYKAGFETVFCFDMYKKDENEKDENEKGKQWNIDNNDVLNVDKNNVLLSYLKSRINLINNRGAELAAKSDEASKS